MKGYDPKTIVIETRKDDDRGKRWTLAAHKAFPKARVQLKHQGITYGLHIAVEFSNGQFAWRSGSQVNVAWEDGMTRAIESETASQFRRVVSKIDDAEWSMGRKANTGRKPARRTVARKSAARRRNGVSITATELAALRRYAAEYGRTWKQHLRRTWEKGTEDRALHGMYTSVLRGLRNRIGPSGLARITITERKANKGRKPAKRRAPKARRANCGRACKSWKKVR